VIDYRRYYLLADWPTWARGLLVIAITVLLVILLLLFLPDASGDDQSESGGFKMAAEESRPYVIAQAPTEPTKYDAQILVLEREAIDEAFREQMKTLFIIWMRDESRQPERALTGARQARSAYVRIMQAFERRQEQSPK
jgi:hypothetical protein